MNLQSTVKLANGVKMPWLGLGVFQVEDGETTLNAVRTAIKNGYRSIDTAAIYDNEAGVGKGIREGIQLAGIHRKDLFITSKVWNEDLGYEETLKAFEVSLEKLGLDYLDLYLIHWPKEGKYKEAWRAMENLYKEGKIKGDYGWKVCRQPYCQLRWQCHIPAKSVQPTLPYILLFHEARAKDR